MGDDLQSILDAYRAGDPGAQSRLLGLLEEQIRGIARGLMGKRIRTERESMDVCQSLLLAFHLRAKEGKVSLPNEEALRAYLRSMVRHKLANVSDRIQAAKRGGGEAPLPVHAGSEAEEIPLPSFDPSASMVAATSELRRRLDAELEPDERAILEGRLAGRTNEEIAAELGRSPDAVRMCWNRARARLQAKRILPDG